jgi:hypothetical protein
MSFLAPLFLAGSIALGLPIVFHLIRRTTRERKVFSSLIFLVESPPRLTKRSRLEHLFLLFLRCAAICLLAFGFARPFLKEAVTAPADSGGKRILLLVDTSASMRRANLWSDARSKVDSVLRSVQPGDQVALFTFDRQVSQLVTFDQWSAASPGERAALLSSKLSAASPGWGATQLGSALVQAAETLVDAGGKRQDTRGRIELITDLEEGSHLEQLQGYEWPQGVQVSINILRPRSSNNAALQLVSDGEESEVKPGANLRVRITNVPGSKREQFKVGWALPNQTGFADKPLDAYVPAGQSRVLSVPMASSRSMDRILLKGDDDEFDNVVFARTPEPLQVSVTYLGNDAEANPKQPFYFLKRAFQNTRHQAVTVVAHRPGELIPTSEAQASSLFVLTAPLPKQTVAAIRAQVSGGKTLLVVPEGSEMKATLGQLLELDNFSYQETRPANYAMLGEVDFRHPIFAAFADPRFSDFTKIHFWRYLRLDPAAIPKARVLARFDSGDPALLEVPLGAGRILLLTSSWQPESSQLAVSSKFVPLLYSILETSGVAESRPAQYQVGDSVSLEGFKGTSQASIIVRKPDGSQETVPGDHKEFSATQVPGVYSVSTEQGTKDFVVNLDPAESRTAPLSADELERLGVPSVGANDIPAREAERKVRLQNSELENRQKLWRWFIAGTCIVLLFESWLAGRTARRIGATPATVSAG